MIWLWIYLIIVLFETGYDARCQRFVHWSLFPVGFVLNFFMLPFVIYCQLRALLDG